MEGRSFEHGNRRCWISLCWNKPLNADCHVLLALHCWQLLAQGSDLGILRFHKSLPQVSMLVEVSVFEEQRIKWLYVELQKADHWRMLSLPQRCPFPRDARLYLNGIGFLDFQSRSISCFWVIFSGGKRDALRPLILCKKEQIGKETCFWGMMCRGGILFFMGH